MVPYPVIASLFVGIRDWNGRLVWKIERMMGMEGKDFDEDQYPHERRVGSRH